MTDAPLTTADLREQLVRLHPWHMNVQVTEDLSTGYVRSLPPETLPPGGATPARALHDGRESFHRWMRSVYPDGLQGRRLLDCACNCGGFCFWAKELGAGETFGFDAREHWIRQALFLKAHRPWPSDNMRFETMNLLDLPSARFQPFDVTIFHGIFYHLADPFGGLKIAADLTREILLLGTAACWLHDPEPGHGMLIASRENTASFLAGVEGPNWLPSGPKVLNQMLGHLGFVETRVLMDRRPKDPPDPAAIADPGRWTEVMRARAGRITIIASKVPGLLAAVKNAKPSVYEFR